MDTTGKSRGKLFAVIATLALSCAMMLCMVSGAFATDFTNAVSTTSIQVRIGSSGAVTPISFGTTAVPYHSVDANTTPKVGALFYKNSAYNVIGTSSYVTLRSVLEAAAGDTTINYIKFYCKDPTGTGTPAYGFYETKFNSGEYGKFYLDYTSNSYITTAGLYDSLPFYEGTTISTLGTDPTYPYSDGAILALTAYSTPLDSSTLTTASGAISYMFENSSFATGTAPRLMWGYDSNSQAGNRFPSQIVGIEIN